LARLLLVRHGETEYNSTYRIMGASDIDLSEKGFLQAEKLGERLAGEKIDAVYSSDLCRAVSTTQAAVNSRNLKINVSSALREMNYGMAEGMTYDELKKAYPGIAEYVRNFNTNLKFPGGESFLEFVSRSTGFMDAISEYKEDQTVLIVTHGGVIKVLVCHLLGIDQVHWQQIRIDNASLSIISTYENRVILSLLNDTSHLKGINN